jgi:hypothetical protein
MPYFRPDSNDIINRFNREFKSHLKEFIETNDIEYSLEDLKALEIRFEFEGDEKDKLLIKESERPIPIEIKHELNRLWNNYF